MGSRHRDISRTVVLLASLLIVSSFIRDLVLDQLEEDGELEESRILKALELSYKEVYDLEEML